MRRPKFIGPSWLEYKSPNHLNVNAVIDKHVKYIQKCEIWHEGGRIASDTMTGKMALAG